MGHHVEHVTSIALVNPKIGAEGRVSRRCREVVIATHPAFEQLSETYKYFREYSSFLYTGTHKHDSIDHKQGLTKSLSSLIFWKLYS